MRFLLDGTTIDRGGRLTDFETLLSALDRLAPDHEFFIVQHATHHGVIRSLPARFSVIPLALPPRPKLRRVLWAQRGIPRLIREHAIDAAYFPSPLTTIGCPVPYIVDLRDGHLLADIPGTGLHMRVRNAVGRSIAGRVLHGAQRVLLVSEFSRSLAIQRFGLPAACLRVAHHAIPAEFLASPTAATSRQIEAPYLLTVAAIQPHKNLRRAIRAFLTLCAESTFDWDYVIAGEVQDTAEARAIQALLHADPHGERVHLLGAVPRAQLPPLYRHAEALLLPSLFETFGLPLLEAMAVRLPIAASERAALPEIAGDAAIYMDPLNATGFAQAIRRLHADAALRAQLAANGRARAAHFDSDVRAHALLAELLAAAGGAR